MKVNPFAASLFAFVKRMSTVSSFAAVSSLPPLMDYINAPSSENKQLTTEEISNRFSGKHVAYYFSAGWCPMCTGFEPSLKEFMQNQQRKSKNTIELIYVPSDKSEDDAEQRSRSLNMVSVPFGEEADALKKKCKIWAGKEREKLGDGRRSGVPAIVVLDGRNGNEMAFLPTEAQGSSALNDWPFSDSKGLWK